MQIAPANRRWKWSSSMVRRIHSSWPHSATRNNRAFDLSFMIHRNSTDWSARLRIASPKLKRSWSISRRPSKKNSPNTPPNVSSSAKPWVDCEWLREFRVKLKCVCFQLDENAIALARYGDIWVKYSNEQVVIGIPVYNCSIKWVRFQRRNERFWYIFR